jgi:ATP-dependent DNA ligase
MRRKSSSGLVTPRPLPPSGSRSFGSDPPHHKHMCWPVTRRTLPARYIVPAQPIERDKPPTGPGWVHEIKHDGYRLIVRTAGCCGSGTRNAFDYTNRMPAIAAAASYLKAERSTIDGELVVIGPDGLSRIDELRLRDSAKSAVLFAFGLIEHNGEDLRALPFSSARPRWLGSYVAARPTSSLMSTPPA